MNVVTKTAAFALFSTVVLNCGGGSSSGSGGTIINPNTSGAISGVGVESSVEIDENGNQIGEEYGTGAKLVFGGDTIAYDWDNSVYAGENRLNLYHFPVLLNGEPYNEGRAFLLGYYNAGVFFSVGVRSDGEVVSLASVSPSENDNFANSTPIVNTTIDDIDYAFAISTLDRWDSFAGTEGRLTISGNGISGSFDAQGHSVEIDGFLTGGGTIIGGDAILSYEGELYVGELEGFVGADASSGSDETVGAFAGGDGDLSFSGGWTMFE